MAKVKVRVGSTSPGAELHLFPGQNLFTGEKPFVEEFKQINSLERDILNLASGIFGTDLLVERQEREHYIRTIEMTVEVVNLHAFKRISNLLEEALHTVSRDNWTIKFIASKGEAVSELEWSNGNGAVLLFSGGLDSMAGATQLVSDHGEVVLVSHNSHGNAAVDDCQRNVHNALQECFSKPIRHVHIKVYGRNKGDYSFPTDRENTQRTRSFMFLSLAAIVSRRVGLRKVLFMAENGQFAIHLPLTEARVSAFSTHTADPHFVRICEELFRILLNNEEFEIFNPYLYKTKAEVFALLPDNLKEKAKYSASCWKISRTPGNKHCGVCIPCISRRISIEFNGFSFDEYDKDLFAADLNSLSDDDIGKRNLVDYLEFITKFRNVNAVNKMDLLMEFSELFNPDIDQDKALTLYERVAQQSFQVFSKYPGLLEFLQ